MKKLVYGALALSAAMAVGLGVGANDAKAEGDSPYSFSVDGETLTIVNEGAKTIMVGATSLTKDSTATDSLKDKVAFPKAVSAWDSYTATEGIVRVDLSKYSNKKDNFFLVKSDMDLDSDAVLVEVPMSPSIGGSLTWSGAGKFSAKDTKKTPLKDMEIYAIDGALEIVDNEDESFLKGNPIYFTEIKENGSATGEYQFPDDTWKKYSYMGATLTVMKSPTVVDEENGFATLSSYTYDVKKSLAYTTFRYEKGGTKTIPSFMTNSRAGVPVKLTVPKIGAAPKVTVDYVKGKIAVAKKTNVTFKEEAEGDPSDVPVKKTQFNSPTEYGETSEDATAADYYGGASNSYNEKSGLSFWVGSLNAVLKKADDAKLNYVLKPTIGKKFYIDVYGPDKNYGSTRVGRTVFQKLTKTTNPSGTYKVVGETSERTDAKKIAWKPAFAGGVFSLVFESADLQDSYTINITDYETGAQNAVTKTLVLKAASKKGGSGADKDDIKLSSQTYKTKIGVQQDFEAALAATDASKGIKITIQRNGSKGTLNWPGTVENFAFNADGQTENLAEFAMNDFKPTEDVDDCVTFASGAYSDKLYVGTKWDAIKDDDAKAANAVQYLKAKPGSTIIVDTLDEITMTYYKPNVTDPVTVDAAVLKDGTTEKARKFTIPKANAIDKARAIVIAKKKWEIELTGASDVPVYTFTSGDTTENRTTIAFDSSKKASIDSGTDIYILKESVSNIDVKLGTQSVTPEEATMSESKVYYKFTLKGGNVKLNLTKAEAASDPVNP